MEGINVFENGSLLHSDRCNHRGVVFQFTSSHGSCGISRACSQRRGWYAPTTTAVAHDRRGAAVGWYAPTTAAVAHERRGAAVGWYTPATAAVVHERKTG